MKKIMRIMMAIAGLLAMLGRFLQIVKAKEGNGNDGEQGAVGDASRENENKQ